MTGTKRVGRKQHMVRNTLRSVLALSVGLSFLAGSLAACSSQDDDTSSPATVSQVDRDTAALSVEASDDSMIATTTVELDATTATAAQDPSLALFDVTVPSGIAQVSIPIPEGWDRDDDGALAPIGSHSYLNDFAFEGTCGGSCDPDQTPEHMEADLEDVVATPIVVFDLDDHQYESTPRVTDSIDDGLIQIRLIEHTYPKALTELADSYRSAGDEKAAAAPTFEQYSEPTYEIYCFASFPDEPFYVYGHRIVAAGDWKTEWNVLSQACAETTLHQVKAAETFDAGDEVTIDTDDFGDVHQVIATIPAGWEYVEGEGMVPVSGGPYDGALNMRITVDCNGSCDPQMIPDQLDAYQQDLLNPRSYFPEVDGDEVLLPVTVVDKISGEHGSGAFLLRVTSPHDGVGDNSDAEGSEDSLPDLEFDCASWDGQSDRFIVMRADSVPESALDSFESFAKSCAQLELKPIEGP
ncbi:MAG: hypothetical protein KDB86_05460 [Actinobacteria bacterium]|nr:hypothetical protein [Actinomycetota bacterium]MCB9390068.1 hypothetical protein [Acidimicrobiia bacterium]